MQWKVIQPSGLVTLPSKDIHSQWQWCSGEQGTVVWAAAQRILCRYAKICISGTPKCFWLLFLTAAVPTTLRILKWLSVVHVSSNTLVLSMVHIHSTTCCINLENHHLRNTYNKIMKTSDIFLVDSLN